MATGLHHLSAEQPHRLAILPTTRPGRWALGMAAASIVLLLSWSLLGRLGGVPGLALGVAGGIAAFDAIFRHRERGLTVYLALVPFLNAVVFVLGSLLFG